MKDEIEKVIKNPDSPGGRKDWEGRSPRIRLSVTNSQLLILKEWAEEYFLKYPGCHTSDDYRELYDRIVEHSEKIQTPLTETTYNTPIFDEDWTWNL